MPAAIEAMPSTYMPMSMRDPNDRPRRGQEVRRDAKHGRQVAIKVLHSELAMSLGREPFRRDLGGRGRLISGSR